MADDMTTQEPQADTATDDQTSPPDTGDAIDWKTEADKWKALAQKHEVRAKSNATAAKRAEELERQLMSDAEKAIAAAKDEATKAAREMFGSRLVSAEVKAAAAGRMDAEKLGVLIDGLNVSKFLTEDGEPDTAAISAWVDSITPAAPEAPPAFPDLGQGDRGSNSTAQIAAMRAAAGLS